MHLAHLHARLVLVVCACLGALMWHIARTHTHTQSICARGYRVNGVYVCTYTMEWNYNCRKVWRGDHSETENASTLAISCTFCMLSHPVQVLFFCFCFFCVKCCANVVSLSISRLLSRSLSLARWRPHSRGCNRKRILYKYMLHIILQIVYIM